MHELTHQDLLRIRTELAHIARLIGPGTGYQMLFEDADSSAAAVELPLGELLPLVPPAWIRELPGEAEAVLPVTVMIDHLFEQIESNRIEVSVAQLVANIPQRFVDYQPNMLSPKKAVLPFESVLDTLMGDLLTDD